MLAVALSLLLAVPSSATHQSRIVGGWEVKSPSDFPYNAQVLDSGSFICSGAILSELWVLTTASCVSEPEIPADLLSIKVGTLVQGDETGTLFKIENVVAHRFFSSTPYLVNDIAALKTSHSIEFQDSVQPIHLYSGESLPAQNAQMVVTGWGLLDSEAGLSVTLKALNTYFQAPEICTRRTNLTHVGMSCLFNSRGQGLCGGDNGAPAVYQGELFGIGSFGFGGCAVGEPDIFTNTIFFRDWILEAIRTS